MLIQSLLFPLLLIAVIAFALFTHKLTFNAAIAASILAIIIFIGTGFPGIALLGSFFIMGVAATSWKQKTKEQFGVTENRGKRNAGQVVANGGIAGLISLAAWCFPAHHPLFLILIACSFSSAAADTISSELGTVYGKKFYNIVSFKKDKRGENGVISFEGTILGMAGSMVIAIVFSLAGSWNAADFIIITIAGTIGNLADSVLGATFEKKGLMNNDRVNMLNTFIGGVAGFLLAILIKGL